MRKAILSAAFLAFAAWFLFPRTEIRITGTTAPPAPVRHSATTPSDSFLAVGDIMLGRYVRTLSEQNGRSYPFAQAADWLNGTDAVLGNLEGPILPDAPVTPLNSLRFGFLPETAEVLSENNFRVVSLANNHALDQGAAGFAATREILARAGIQAAGNPSQATSVVAFRTARREIRVVALNATWPNFRREEALALVRTEAAQGPSVVLVHWGEEYQGAANAFQTDLGRALVDAGALIVFGHHPHVVQNLEIYRGRPIFYSLGNFVFDQYFSPETQQGLAVRVEFDARNFYCGLHPYRIVRSQVVPLTENERTDWLADYAARNPQAVPGLGSGELSLPLPEPAGT